MRGTFEIVFFFSRSEGCVSGRAAGRQVEVGGCVGGVLLARAAAESGATSSSSTAGFSADFR